MLRARGDCIRRARRLGGVAEALFWQGCYRQVLAADEAAAKPLFEQARELSQQVGDSLTLSYALRHLGILRHVARDLDAAECLLQESTSLRREIGFDAGVAANLVGLSYIALDNGDRQQALSRAQQAERVARGCGANAVVKWAIDAGQAATG